MLSEQTIHLINSFGCGINDPHAQDVMLHAIFSRIVVADHVSQNPVLFLQACMTLARLYWDQKWDPARVFLYMLTGHFVTDDEPLVLSQSAFSILNGNFPMSQETINGLCDLHAEIFNVLWYKHENSEESESEDDESGEDSDEHESEHESEHDTEHESD